MKITLMSTLVLCGLLVSLSSFAASSSSSYQAPLVTKSLLLDITQANQRIVAVGERGHILLTEDGKAWRQVEVPSLTTLTGVDFVETFGWAVGHDTTILHSQDNGKTWTVQYSEPSLERPFLDVHFFDKSHGIAIGAYGLFFRTRDGGLTWDRELHAEFLSQDDQAYLADVRLEDESFYLEELASILPHLNSVSFDNGTLYLAGEAGLLATSLDQGLTWQKMDIDYAGSFFDVRATASGRIFAAGLRGNLFELNNDGEWDSIDSQSKSSLNTIITIDQNTTLVAGNNGAMVTITPESASFKQSAEGKAIVSGLIFNGQLITVTEDGIKHFDKGQ